MWYGTGDNLEKRSNDQVSKVRIRQMEKRCKIIDQSVIEKCKDCPCIYKCKLKEAKDTNLFWQICGNILKD